MSSSIKIDSKKHKVSSLEHKYKNMAAPEVKIYIDGKEIIKSMGMAVEYLDVDLSVNASDTFEFSVVNAYDHEESEIKWIDSKLKAGKEIKIEIGYTDELKEIFYGYITNIRISSEYEDSAIKVIVSGMDKSFLMMRGKKTNIWNNSSYSDVVNEIAKKYVSKKKVSSTPTVYDSLGQVSQTDYEFIKFLAFESGYEFFVTGDTLYFRKYHEDKTPITTLTLGENIIEIDLGVDIADQIGECVVKGWDSLKREEIMVKENSFTKVGSGKTSGVSIIKSIGKDNVTTNVITSLKSKNEAKIIGKGMMEKSSLEYVYGRVEVMGMPEIIPGRYIKIDKLGNKINDLYYINRVKHSINEDGYRTIVNLGGNTF
ncbi:MAG: contractile injection system protein, VgrG/Pvc8 family [Peptostreptococcaceae bacterium]|jgi:phage protein D|nr:contractile injection system protein, VgrG/Pvc8 family [Peptostreptococcaceae bacterium]